MENAREARFRSACGTALEVAIAERPEAQRKGSVADADRVSAQLGAGADCPCQAWIETISGMIRIATMLVILIIGLIAGPAVSL
jgi:hypothetical protein